MTTYTKCNPWRDSDGTASLCIGCDFNIYEDWPDSMFTHGITRENHFPPVNSICNNPESPMHHGCIIGHVGCEFTSLPD